jgi:hypothetical protein
MAFSGSIADYRLTPAPRRSSFSPKTHESPSCALRTSAPFVIGAHRHPQLTRNLTQQSTNLASVRIFHSSPARHLEVSTDTDYPQNAHLSQSHVRRRRLVCSRVVPSRFNSLGLDSLSGRLFSLCFFFYFSRSPSSSKIHSSFHTDSIFTTADDSYRPGVSFQLFHTRPILP